MVAGGAAALLQGGDLDALLGFAREMVMDLREGSFEDVGYFPDAKALLFEEGGQGGQFVEEAREAFEGAYGRTDALLLRGVAGSRDQAAEQTQAPQDMVQVSAEGGQVKALFHGHQGGEEVFQTPTQRPKLVAFLAPLFHPFVGIVEFVGE